jgi:hypothetical protein
MDLESFTLYLNKKHLSAVAVHTEINSVLGESTIGFNCHSLLAEAKFCKCFAPGPEEPDLGAADIIDSAILQALDE